MQYVFCAADADDIAERQETAGKSAEINDRANEFLNSIPI